MEYTINETPLLMRDITAKIFNSEHLSDITFLVEGQKIYAHSLILMVRSNVFQQQLEITYGEKKIIPITDYGYEVFYQFIQFIYTDQIDNTGPNTKNLLKLAIHYNVIRLINHMMNRNVDYLVKLDWYRSENCKIELNRNSIKNDVAVYLKYYLDSDVFTMIHSETLEEVLKLDRIEKGVTESCLLDALVRWLNNHCEKNQITFTECRNKFINLIHLIRFPTMSSEELQNIKTKYPDLLTESDLSIFAKQKIFGPEYDDGIWNSSPRTECIAPYELKTYPDVSVFKTKFSVSSDMFLRGFAFGRQNATEGVKRMNITISCVHLDLSKVSEININDVELEYHYSFINLGASICVRPNYIYTIECKYEPKGNQIQCVSRQSQTGFIIYPKPNSVTMLEVHPTMLEISIY